MVDTHTSSNGPSDPGNGGDRRGPKGIWKVLLIASLALNVLVLGLIAGAFLRAEDERPGRRSPPIGREIGVAPILELLEPEDRRAMGREVFRELRRNPDRRAEMRGRLAAVATLLRQDVVDQAALEALFADHSEEVLRRHQKVQQVLAETLAAKTPEERAALASQLEDFAENGLPPRPGKKKRDFKGAGN